MNEPLIGSHCNSCRLVYIWKPGMDKHLCPSCINKSILKETMAMPLNDNNGAITESTGPRRLAYEKVCVHCKKKFNPTNNKQLRCKSCSDIPLPDSLKLKYNTEATIIAPHMQHNNIDLPDQKSYNRYQRIVEILCAAGHQDLIAKAEALLA